MGFTSRDAAAAAPLTDLEKQFSHRALIANSLLGSLQRIVGNGPLLQLIGITQFQLTDAQYAVVTAVFSTATLAQIVGLTAQYRFGVYGVLVDSYELRTVLLVLMAAVPLLAEPGSTAGALGFFLCAYLVCACHAAGFNVCWPAIVRAGTDARSRGRITARLRSVQVILAAAMVLIITLVGAPALTGLPFAALLGVFAVYSFSASRQVRWMQARLPVAAPSAERTVVQQLRSDLRTLLAMPAYRRFLGMLVLFGLSTFPIQIYFLRDVVGLNVQDLFWYSTALTWAGILSIQAWGRAIDRFGAWTGLRGASVVIVLMFALLLSVLGLDPTGGQAMARPMQAVIVVLLLGLSIAFQGVGLLWFNCSLDVVPAKVTTLGVLLLSVAYEVAAVCAAVTMTFLRGHALAGLPHREVLIVGLWLAVAAASMALTWRCSKAMAKTVQGASSAR